MDKMKNKLLSAAGILILVLSFLNINIQKAYATSLSYTLSVSSNCAVLVSGSASSTANVVNNETSNLTVFNSDLIVSISVSGGGVPGGSVLQPNNKASTKANQTFQLGTITSQQTITFTAIPNSTNPAAEGNNCPTGSTPISGKLIINPIAPTSKTTTTKTTSKTTTPANTTNENTSTSTDKVEVTSIEAAGKSVPVGTTFDIGTNDTLNITGKTVAKGEITLTIHSEPKTTKVTADASGKWTYSVAWLEPGSHYIEAAVTNPATKQTSATTKLLSFNVKGANGETSTKAKKSNNTIFIIGGALVLLFAGIAGFMFLRKKKNVPTDTPSDDNQMPPVDNQTPTISGPTLNGIQ